MLIYIFCVASVITSSHSSNANNIRSFQYERLVSDLSARVNAKCLFFIYAGTSKLTLDFVQRFKTLSINGTVVGCLKPQDIMRKSRKYRCKGNRPIYALFADQDTSHFLQIVYKISSHPRWIIFFESSQPIDKFFEKVYVPFNAEVFVAEALTSYVKISEVYQVAADLPLKKQSFGTWSPNTGLRTPNTFSLYQRRKQLDGITLDVVASSYHPETTLFNESGRLRVGGLFGSVWRIIENDYNFSSSVQEVPSDAFGSFVNGSWTGMIGMLDRKEVHVAVGGFTYERERMYAVTYLSPIVLAHLQLFIRKPDTMRYQWNGFLSPFSPTLWLMIVASVIVAGVLLNNFFRYGRRYGVESENLAEQHDFSLFGSMLSVHGLFCSQGPTTSPQSNSCRLVLFTVGLASAVVLAAYSGALTSFIAVLQLALPYETIEEYVDDPRYELGMTGNGIGVYLNNPSSSLYQKLRERLLNKRDQQPKHRLLGLKKLCDTETPYGWFASRLLEEGLLDTLGCEITTVPGHLVIDTLSIIVAKGSPYRQLFNHKIAALRTSGVLHHLIAQTWPDRVTSGENALPKVELSHVVPLLGVLALGVLAGAALGALELLVYARTSTSV